MAVRQLPGMFFDPATFQTSENAASPESTVAAPTGFDSLQALFQASIAAHYDRATACHTSHSLTHFNMHAMRSYKQCPHVPVHTCPMFCHPSK